MSEWPSALKQKFSEEPYFWLALALGIAATSIGLGLYAYLGTFSRYGSDDYCLTTFFLQDDVWGRFIRRYFVTSGRYTNILFIGLVDKLFGWYNVAILPLLMLGLLVLGLYLLLKEIGEMVALGESRWIAVFMAVSITCFSISQAPDLYETLYWRAGMTSHFAPLVFFLFLGVFLLKQIRKAGERSPAPGVLAVGFLGAFLVGGLSEPPTAMMIAILFLALCAVWWRGEGTSRQWILALLLWTLLGSVLALIVMAFAPANSLRLQTAPPSLLELIWGILIHPLEFIVDTIRTLPMPTLISIAMPAVLFYVKYTDPAETRSTRVLTPSRLGILLIAVLLLMYILIAANFAPSVYGQSYPVARARFAGRLLMTSALMIEGTLLGILGANVRMNFFQSTYSYRFASLVLLLLVLYPLRGAWRTSAEIPAYQQRAAAWDLRDSEIRALKAQGVQDLVVRFLPDEQIQDLGDRTGFRLNRCASIIYGVNSIVAVPMEEE
ncbi:MAG TPA: DUF6056 family protein [Anaerolineales bacterium]|nr:DUF6056 family protein [Anaerolineales bacterium]